jgi:hypothetical protein
MFNNFHIVHIYISVSINKARVEKMSNHRITDSELHKWIVAMKDGRQPTLTPLECRRRHDRLKEITTNHT